MTSRWYQASPPVRCIMTFRSGEDEFGNWPDPHLPPPRSDLILNGSSAHQLYSSITFPYFNIYLGLVMVFDASQASTVGTVECRLAWSAGVGQPWSFVGGWTPWERQQQLRDADKPSSHLSQCGANVSFDTDCATKSYRMAPVASWEACCAMCAADDGKCLNWVFAGRTCHLRPACTSGTHEKRGAVCGIFPGGLKPSPSPGPPGPPAPPPAPGPRPLPHDETTSQAQFIPRGRPGSFDSHVIFAASHPVPTAEGVRVYCETRRPDLLFCATVSEAPPIVASADMGGNGPHTGPRNTSLGLATLRHDGFIAVGGTGYFVLQVPVPCGHALALTLDVTRSGGSVRVGIVGEADLSLARAVPLATNATRAQVRWEGGGDLSKLAGKNVTLEFELRDANVYTVAMLDQRTARAKTDDERVMTCPLNFTCYNQPAAFLKQLHDNVHSTDVLKIALLCAPSAPCTIGAETLGRGGVVIGHSTEAVMSYVTIADRTQIFSGALMRLFGTLTGRNVTWRNGTCANGCSGAAILLEGMLNCTDCVFENNRASCE